ncbi:MAG: phytanoyl-CoA dioxygenase family protein [Pyrinomonadaceae bacterium]
MSFGIRTLKGMFSDNKVVDSKRLNLFGMQVVRTLAARLAHTFRSADEAEFVKDKVDELRSEGILVLHDFLPRDLFERVEQECRRLLDEKPDKLPDKRFGLNVLERSKILSVSESELPNVYEFLANPEIHAILRAAEKRSFDSHFASGRPEVNRLIQGNISDEVDVETNLHSDVFFNTHKLWLYLTDIENKDGPFVYVKRSHRLSLTQLRYIYDESRKQNMGSRRISPEELEQVGLKETTVTCPKNTVVIANTYGYHRRLSGQQGGKREAIHIHLRAHPFRPSNLSVFLILSYGKLIPLLECI